MKQTSWLLMGLLLLFSAACARRDWVSDLLVLTDVTGTWEGSMTAGAGTWNSHMTMVLQQTGPKVTGEFRVPAGSGALEGVVSGDVLSFSRG